MELFGLPEGLARAGKAVKGSSGGSCMPGSRPEGPYADGRCDHDHRGSIYALRMPQEPQRVFARYRSDISYPEDLRQPQPTGQPTREMRFHTLFVLAANVQFRQPQPTGSAAAPQEPQSGFYHADGRFIGQTTKSRQKPF
jgi:hypothetical protein